MKKKHDLNHILAVGDQLFREQGYHNTGTEEILEKAGYPRSSFYYHFKSKEGFGVKAVEFYGNNIKALLEEILENSKEGSPTKRLKEYFSTVSKYVVDRKYESCCLVQRFSMEAGEQPGVLQEAAYEQFKGWTEVVESCVEKGQELGELRKDLDKKELTEFLFVTIFGTYTVGRLSKDPEEFKNKIDLAFKLIRK